jgi:hypothetical protein
MSGNPECLLKADFRDATTLRKLKPALMCSHDSENLAADTLLASSVSVVLYGGADNIQRLGDGRS